MFALKLKITLLGVYYLLTIEGKRIDVEVKGTNGTLKLIGRK